MATPSAPSPISINDINVELGSPGTTLRTLNDAAVRTLAGPAFASPGTTISLNDLRGKSSYSPLQYLYTGGQQTTVSVPPGTTRIVFAGIAMGAPGGSGGAGSSGNGGGGGAANLAGYTINPAAVYAGTTLYIGVGGPAAPGNTYVRTSSHSGPVIFELNQGSGSSGGAGGSYSSVSGGNGAGPVGRFNGGGGTGGSVTGAGAGGGSGGGGGDNSPLINGAPGAPGGSVTMPGSLLSPIGSGPSGNWTWGSTSSGGSGGTIGVAGNQAPSSGAFGGFSGGQPWTGGGGGGGAGVILNGVSYGGGGGGAGGFGAPGSPPQAGAPGFLIVQFSNV